MKNHKVPTYPIEVFWSDEDQEFTAVCRSLPGVSAGGSTYADAVAELETVIALALETYEEEGWPIPEVEPAPTYSGQFRLRLTKTLHEELVVRATREGVSLNTLATTYLAEAVGTARSGDAIRKTLAPVLQQLQQMKSEFTSTHAAVMSLKVKRFETSVTSVSASSSLANTPFGGRANG